MKRKGFCGTKGTSKRQKLTTVEENQDGVPSIQHVANVSEPCESEDFEPRVNVSATKLKNSSFSKFEEQQSALTRAKRKSTGLSESVSEEVASGFKLQDAKLLGECIATAAICSNCQKPQSKLSLFQRDTQREGLAESLFLRYSICKHKTELKTSQRLGGIGGGAHEVNRRSVMASHKLGQAGLEDFCARMNFPPPVTKKSFNEHLIQIEKAAVKHAGSQMQEAAKRLLNVIKKEQPENIANEEGTETAEVAVTVDGTWQKRGHSSKIGVVFILSLVTGEVLDYEIKSLVCFECRAHEHLKKDSDAYKKWKASHSFCQVNHFSSKPFFKF